MATAPAETFLLVDGENIDATLGGSLLGRRPAPEERPRWDRVRDYGRAMWDQPLRGLFFLNGSGQVPMSFVQALDAWTSAPCCSAARRTSRSSTSRSSRRSRRSRSAAAATCCWPATTATSPRRSPSCCATSDRRVGIIGFRELISSSLQELTDDGLELFDLEDDVKAFTVALPRIRVIPIERFDPWALLA